ncbi:MAG: 5'-nucleotidase [Gammaproteobacteria bacterium]|nr:5'-nucleotidase [Gammaproteobacteria bacterium]
MAPPPLPHRLVIAISSRILFDLDEGHQVFEREGVEAYARYQIEHENEILKPGVAFSVVCKLLAFNHEVDEHHRLVEIILLSRNTADTGLRIFNSIAHYGLTITRAVFAGGRNPYQYVNAFGADLFLSTHPEDIQSALRSGLAAARILLSSPSSHSEDELRIAFDGDVVVFSDEADRIYRKSGLEAFQRNEIKAAKTPLAGGPFKDFLMSLHVLQKQGKPIRIALVTSRSAPAHERVIRTLRSWGIRIDEAFFLGGLNKTEFLKAFGADLYFDDEEKQCESTREHMATGFVPGVRDKG